MQKLENFKAALKQLSSGIELSHARTLSELEKLGLIQTFKFTHELAWNVIEDFFVVQGNTTIQGSRDAACEAFQKNIVTKGDAWMEMIQSRNLTSHTYNKNVANDIVDKVIRLYEPVFKEFEIKMDSLKPGQIL